MGEIVTVENKTDGSLKTVIEAALKIPYVKVDKNDFLRKEFIKEPIEKVSEILEKGTVGAGLSKSELRKKANKLINDRTLFSSGASFLAGIPGGMAIAATIPADTLQFYAVALRLAQELAYLYGQDDIFEDCDDETVTDKLVLYCGTMFGVSYAACGVRIAASAMAKQVAKKLPQKALTKTFYYPVIKSVLKAFGVKITKTTFSKGVAKAIPIVGGIVSGGLTFATMRPMGVRLADTLERAIFDYDDSALKEDISVVESLQST